MKYPHIKKYKFSHRIIAKALGYKNVNAFRCSSAHKRIMKGIEELLSKISENNLIGYQSNCFDIDLGGYLLKVKLDNVSYFPTKSSEVLIRCTAICKV